VRWKKGSYTFNALARFDAKAVVLSRKNYGGDHDGDVCRTDFALGWGAMSEAGVINALSISQDMRWFFYEWRGKPPAPPDEITSSCANMHLIPASEDVASELARVRRHELLEFSGYLVEVKHPDGWNWRSSLSRADTGAGACEVVWVERVAHHAIAAP
jgi:hypothetical protein